MSDISEKINFILWNADYFVLTLIRVGGLVVSSPIFGRVGVPARVKIVLVMSLALLFSFCISPTEPIVYTTLFGFLLKVAGEMLIGIAMAFITNVFFTLTFTAGQLIDMQIGFGIVNVYDAQNNTQIPMLGNLMNLILLIVFFGVDGHLRLIETLFMTFQSLPVGNVGLNADIGLVAARAFALAFTTGVSVALPVIASGIVIELSFGLLLKTVPQMNMFVVGVPLKLMIGFALLLFILPVFINFSGEIFSSMFREVSNMFDAFLKTP